MDKVFINLIYIINLSRTPRYFWLEKIINDFSDCSTRKAQPSALASPSKIVTRVSIIGNCKAIVMACTGPAAGSRFKEIK